MRLIDADALMVKLTYSPNGVRYREFDCDNFPSTLTLRDAKKLVREEPTVSPIPDPITGLFPCGCGGKAEYYYHPIEDWVAVECVECGAGTSYKDTKEQARDAWNLSHSYKGGAE